MNATGLSLHATPHSAAREWAHGFAWLWRLGAVLDAPQPNAIGFGSLSEAAGLAGLVGSGGLAGAIIATGEPGPAVGSIPARRREAGVPEFGRTRVEGEFTLFDSQDAYVRSSIGTHAVRQGNVLILGMDPERDWGMLDAFWSSEAVSTFLSEWSGTPLRKLPPIGALRLDDTPGTAQHQLENRAKGDRRQQGRIRRTAHRLASAGAVLNVAVAAEALSDGRRVPLDEVWPASVRALSDGIATGAYEPVCHGLLHLDTESLERDEIEFREFIRLDAEEAGSRLDRALAWQERHLARPSTFVAPAWTYGPAADEEASKRGLVRWYRARPGPVFEDGRLYETLDGALPGIHGLDYSPLQRLAAIGVPPIVAMHGALLDGRLKSPRRLAEAPTLLRLFLRRDVRRLMALDGIRWLGATEFVDELHAHGAS